MSYLSTLEQYIADQDFVCLGSEQRANELTARFKVCWLRDLARECRAESARLASADRLAEAYQFLRSVIEEGGARGRPMDLLSAKAWNRIKENDAALTAYRSGAKPDKGEE